MKRFILVLFVSTLYLFSMAQKSILPSFNSTMAGRSVILAYSKSSNNKFEFGGGIRYNINQLAHVDDQNKSYYKRLYATEPLHHFGVNVFYHNYIFRQWQHIKPFLFYDVQATYSTSRNRMLLPFSYDTNGDVLYKEYIEIFGPYTWVEQNIGIGFKADIFGNWFFQQKIGFGSSFILGYDKKVLDKYYKWFSWEFGALLTVGVGYRFGKTQ